MRLITRLMKWKMYISRASQYLSIVTSCLIFLTFIKTQGINLNLWVWGLPIIFCTLVMFIVVGYIEVKMGMMKAENDANNKNNPQIMDIVDRLTRIEEKLKRKEP